MMIRKALISLVVVAALPALAAADTPAGWSVDTSKAKQAILSYADQANAPRAQAERRGEAGPVSILLRGWDSPADFSNGLGQ